MFPALLLAAALVAGGYVLGKSGWRLAYAHASRETEARARAMGMSSIATLAVLGPAGQAGRIEVTVVGLPGGVPGVEFTGMVTGANGTPILEGSYLQFGYLNVISVDA